MSGGGGGEGGRVIEPPPPIRRDNHNFEVNITQVYILSLNTRSLCHLKDPVTTFGRAYYSYRGPV